MWHGSSRPALCKVMVADFVKANRYNPDFVGWGDEDVEFYHRLEHVGSAVGVARMPESRQAVVVNLEWPGSPTTRALARGLGATFGHEAPGPLFVPYGPAVAASRQAR